MARIIVLLFLIPTAAFAEPEYVFHMLNKQYVTPEVFTADLKDQDSTLTQDEIDKQYIEFLKELKQIQYWQRVNMLIFINSEKIKTAYVEGLTEKNYSKTMKFVETLKEYAKDKDKSNELLEAQNTIDLIELGAAGQLVVRGKLESISPADDSKAMEAANPVRPDGKIVFDKKAIEKREDAIVRNLRKSNEEFVMIFLGSDHDLSDNIKRLMKNCKYERMDIPKFVKDLNAQKLKESKAGSEKTNQ